MQGIAITVGATALMVAPPRYLLGALDWQAKAYVNGDIVRTSTGAIYWVIVAGTSAVAPSVLGGKTEQEGGGGPLWGHITPGPRRSFFATNTGATVFTVTTGIAPVAGAGSVLQPNGTYSLTAPSQINDAIYAISSAPGGVLAVQDI